MKRFLFAAATAFLAVSGAAHATTVFQSIPDLDMRPADTSVSGPALGEDTATVSNLVLSSGAETPVLLSSGNLDSFSANLARGGWFRSVRGQELGGGLAQEPNLASASSAASLPEPTSWLLAFGGFCTLAAFSGRASGRDRRNRMYVPEVALVTVARERRAL